MMASDDLAPRAVHPGAVVGRAARAVAGAALAGAGALLVLLGLIGLPAGTSVALAACAQEPSLDEAILRGSVVFVGTVVRLENDDRWVTVRVEERWYAAASVPGEVVVRGGPPPGTSTTFDRVYSRARYLFAVEPGTGWYQDSACTATTAWRDDLARYRPAGAVPATGDPLPGPYGTDDAIIVGALMTALVIAVVSYLLILRARRRPPDWMR